MVASLVILASFSTAEAQRGGRGFGGGGRSGGGRISAAPHGGFGGGARISAAPRGGFGGGNRVAVGPHFAPGRAYVGIHGGVSIRGSYGYRGGYYGRPYYGVGYGAYYRSYYPHIGFYLNILPFGYYPFYFGGYPYYYNEGLFYQPYNDGYQVVAPPVGAEVPRLPRGAQEIVIDGQQYFEKDGIYYQPVINEDGKKVYRVAGKDGVLNTDSGVQQPEDQQQEQQHAYNNNNNNNNYNNNTDNNQNPVSLPRVGDVVNSIPPDSRAVRINGEKLFVSPDGVYYQEDNSGNSRIFKVVGVPPTEDGSGAVSNP
ncbi:hypothetical protein GO621_17890 [Mucilaginibacter sp. HMF7410]|uniref:Uncharacterized protein n=1 Tax=Mucilaginibacter arboris TaxID=2682090 RepID=A0A7K1T1H0_9SPHI|nr:hypothetical protein [Mucilaginibacter arboris]